MDKDFTLLLLLQHYPFTQQLQILSSKEMFVATDISDFLKKNEQEVSKSVLDRVYAYAAAAV